MTGSDDMGGNNTSSTEYQSSGQDTVLVDSTQTPLIADFTREGVDLHLNWETGPEVTILDYFSTIHPPAITTAGGAFMDGELVSRLAGPGPMAQSQAGTNDESPIGEITSLGGQVTVRHADGTSGELVEGSAVFKGDIVQTSADGSFSLQFLDETNLSMGENGRVVLDDLVYNASGASNSFGISLLQGAFSIISGLIAKEDADAVSIKTPVGTIGIRGTSWAGKILALGEDTIFTLFSGAIFIVNEAGSQLLDILNQTVIVTSYASAPSLPFILNDSQIFDIYGRTLGQIDPKYNDDDDDFDPEAINPEAGGRFAGGNGGGANFQAFEVLEAALGIDLRSLLDSGDLLDPTQFDLSSITNVLDEALREDSGLPIAIVEIKTAAATGSATVDGYAVTIILDSPATETTTVFYKVTPLGDGSGAALIGDNDLSVIGEGSVVIPIGETRGTVFISILEDDVVENTEFFRIELTGAENAIISPLFNEVLLVIEDDDIGVISLKPVDDEGADGSASAVAAFGILSSSNAVSVSEDEGAVSFKLVLDKALAPGVEISIDYVISGTADSAKTFPQELVDTVVFSGGEEGLPAGSEIIVTTPISDDTTWLGTRQFTISLANPSGNASIDPTNQEIALTIFDDEIPISLEDGEKTLELAEGLAPQSFENQDLDISGGSGSLESLVFNAQQPLFSALGLTSDGLPVTLVGLGTDTVTGIAGGKTLFEVTLNPNGTFDLNLLGPLDHLNGNNQELSIPLVLTITDQNSSTAEKTLVLDLEDAVPTANDDTNEVSEGMEVSGNVIVNILDTREADNPGLDGAEVSAVVSNALKAEEVAVDESGSFTVRGLYGVLTLNPNGEYQYVADNGLNNTESLIDVFDYQLKDTDGDTSAAQLSIHLKDTLEPSFISLEDGVVDEADLIGSRSLTSGRIDVDYNGDGPGSLKLDTSLLPIITNSGRPITYELSEDGLEIEAFVNFDGDEKHPIFLLSIEEVGGAYEYDFSLLNFIDHSGPDNLPISLDFHVIVEDQDGSQQENSFSVIVLNNEAPVAHDDLVLTNALGDIYIPESALLSNDTDADGDPLFVAAVGPEAQLVDDQIHYSVNGSGAFQYTVSDGGAHNSGDVSVTYVSDPVIIGSDLSEIIIGSDSADTIFGSGGDDTIIGAAGDDDIVGDSGEDIFAYSDANDGNDAIYSFEIENDIIDLDAFFDSLNIADREERADLVNIDGSSGHTIITIEEQEGFSIILNSIDLGIHNGDLSANDLVNLARITVSDES